MDNSGEKDAQLREILQSLAQQPNPGGLPGAHEEAIRAPKPGENSTHVPRKPSAGRPQRWGKPHR